MTRTKGDLLSNTDNVKSSKFIDNNTLRIEYNDGTQAIRLHDTNVVTFSEKNFILNSGGWRTSTTKDRINKYSPARIHQDKGIWYLRDGSLFYDGCVIDEQGCLISDKQSIDDAEVNKLKKQIAKYVALITKDNLPVPDAGDCWLCSLRDEHGKTMGDWSTDASHIMSHLEEGYLHGSILVNAMREAGYRDDQIGFHYSLKLADTFKRAVRKYIHKRLLPTIITK